jgi:indole-3-glycerol phosphate synthase
MRNILQKICTDKRDHVERLKKERSFTAMDVAARAASPVRGFENSLRTKITKGEIGFITELKKASPSAGVIRADFLPADLARSYAKAGAACLSVLTDEPYFQGTNDDLVMARAACNLPVLRKDFMLDVWQIAEARAIGADCILLIMAVLDDVMAIELHAAAVVYGMDVLIETHDRAEMERALMLPSGIIGINNRNLKTLEIDLGVTETLRTSVPPDRLVVSESGIRNAADVARLRVADVQGFLVGESLLKQADVSAALGKLR